MNEEKNSPKDEANKARDIPAQPSDPPAHQPRIITPEEHQDKKTDPSPKGAETLEKQGINVPL